MQSFVPFPDFWKTKQHPTGNNQLIFLRNVTGSSKIIWPALPLAESRQNIHNYHSQITLHTCTRINEFQSSFPVKLKKLDLWPHLALTHPEIIKAFIQVHDCWFGCIFLNCLCCLSLACICTCLLGQESDTRNGLIIGSEVLTRLSHCTVDA